MVKSLSFLTFNLIVSVSCFTPTIYNRPIISFRSQKGIINTKMIEYLPNIQVKELGYKISQQWSYSDFLDKLRDHKIEAVSILSNQKGFVAIDNYHPNGIVSPDNLHAVQSFQDLNNNLIDLLIKNKVPFDVLNVDASQNQNPVVSLIDGVFKFALGYIILSTLVTYAFRFLSGGRGMNGINPLQQMKSDIEVIQPGDINQRFSDIAGIDIIKNELVEIVDYLNDSSKYDKAGAKIPKGVLLEGSPGVGKTLLARAVAGEAGVPFISVSGSQFIEMYVGLGASRVRKLFETARSFDNCIIFIDEIDAVGKQRGGGGITGGGNDEREQTLNQILTEMDGFKDRSGIIVIGATNRIDLLDNALTRPGRFDRKIGVPLPDFEARKKIIGIHSRGKVLSDNINIDELSSLSSGFSGADIENLMNEACILSVRNNQTEITFINILDAFEKIQIGLPVDNSNLDPEIKELVAYHEAGHSLCALYFQNAFNFSKATIRATSNGAGGYTLFTPIEKFNSYPTKKYMLAQLVVSMGGRAAEQVLYQNKNNYEDDYIFKDSKYDNLFITSGAVSDLNQANRIAETYISKLGFGDDFLAYSIDDGFDSKTSEITKEKIDKQKRLLIENCYYIAVEILENNRAYLDYIADYLISNQTLSMQDLDLKTIKY